MINFCIYICIHTYIRTYTMARAAHRPRHVLAAFVTVEASKYYSLYSYTQTKMKQTHVQI